MRNPSPVRGLAAYRKSLGESQTVFWDRFGATQAGGSRYEREQPMPPPPRCSCWRSLPKPAEKSMRRQMNEYTKQPRL